MGTVRFFVLVVGSMVIGLSGCAKGEMGPEGPNGEQGPKGDKGDAGTDGTVGPQGPKGDVGNANVILYEFGPRTFTNELDLELSVSRRTVDNSMILVYYNPAIEDPTSWFASPGYGSSANYQTRYFIYQLTQSPSIYRLGLRVLKADGSGAYGAPLSFRKMRIIFAEASSVISARKEKRIDLRNYMSVKEAFQLSD